LEGDVKAARAARLTSWQARANYGGDQWCQVAWTSQVIELTRLPERTMV
jgi:hypothetical protein